MSVVGFKRGAAAASAALTAAAMLALGGCSEGLPEVHSISSLSSLVSSSPAPEKPKGDQPVNVAELITPGALGDIAIGKANAPVTIVQYVSLNCTNCSSFHSQMLPKLKKAYIDKGKARLIVREFPEDGASVTAALALRCVPANDYFKAAEKLLAHQKEWTGTEANKDALYKAVKFTGLKRDKFDACLADQAIIQAINSDKERAKSFGVAVSPTFFVNGKKMAGTVSFEELQSAVETAYAATQAPAAAAQPAQKPKA